MTCEAIFSACVCSVASDHETHECICGGQWRGTDPGSTPIRFPGPFSFLDFLLEEEE